jgi:hypothetical protein
MRTCAARLTIGAYADSTYHVAVITDTYEAGVLKGSEVRMSQWLTVDQVLDVVLGAALNVCEMPPLPRLV